MNNETGPPARRILEIAGLPARQEWTLLDLAASLRRRPSWILASVSGALLLATAYCLLATPRFQATAEIEVQKQSPAAFGLESSVTGDASSLGLDSLDYSLTLETQASILRSPALALQVIQDLNLEKTHDYFPEAKSKGHFPDGLFLWNTPQEPRNITIEDAPNRRYAALKIFASRLKVKPETGTRIIEVSYSDPDPYLAAAVVSHLLEALSNYTYQQRYHATAQASAWLASQLTILRHDTRKLQDRANRLQADTGVYGQDVPHDVLLARLDALNERAEASESALQLAEAVDHITETGDPDLISALSGNVGATSGAGNSLAVMQTLRTREAAVRAEMDENNSRYGEAHPRTAELQAEMDGIENSIHEETARIAKRSHADLEIASAAEKSARDAFEQQKALADQASGKAVTYQLARQDADSSRGVYAALLARLKEAAVLEGLRSTNLAVVTPPRVPPTHHPKSPNLPLCYAAALVGGLFLGSLGAVAAELTDHTVRSFEGLERLDGSLLLGVLPFVPKTDPWLHLLSAKSRKLERAPLFLGRHGPPADPGAAQFLESLRSLRTSLLLLRPGPRSQVILVTSSVPGEGKSLVAVNLAGVLAQLGTRVLLVDADLRCPSVHSELRLNDTAGLNAALAGAMSPQIHGYDRQRNLSVLCGHQASPMPAELLASQKMADFLTKWRAEYDFILLDSPPVLAATDALVLAQMSDITLLVARHGFTDKKAVHRSHAILRDQLPETALMRVVLNGVRSGSGDLRAYYGYNPAAGNRFTAIARGRFTSMARGRFTSRSA